MARFCAAGSPTLVTTPTLFVMRDRHANYAHEMEVVSMAFSFLAAVEPEDVAGQGLQVSGSWQDRGLLPGKGLWKGMSWKPA